MAKRRIGLRSGFNSGLLECASADMMRSDGPSSRLDDDTVVVASERRIMESGSTERGVREGSMRDGGGIRPGASTVVDEVRRSEEWMWRRDEGSTVAEERKVDMAARLPLARLPSSLP
jgi:hypothetical protein